MAWIELHQSLIDHRKVANAAAMLPRTSTTLLIGHLATLWCWGLDSAPAGGPLTAVEIAHGARWTKDADLFVAALQSARLVDRDEDGFWLHDWDDYAGRLVAKRNANTERMRSARAAHVQRTTDARAPHVQGLPNSTQPNSTQPEITHTARVKPEPKRVTEITDEFRAEMVSKYAGDASAERVNLEIDDALGHQAASKRHDKRAYVRNWLTRTRWSDGGYRGSGTTGVRGSGPYGGAAGGGGVRAGNAGGGAPPRVAGFDSTGIRRIGPSAPEARVAG